MEMGDMNTIRPLGHHAIGARRNWLGALAVVGMINTAACTGGLRVEGQGGAAANGGGTGSQGFTNTGGSVGSSVSVNIKPYVICPCGNTSDAAKSVVDPQKVFTRSDPLPRGDSSGLFNSVSMGSNYDNCCGVKSDQTIACWGSDLQPYNTPPTGTFNSVNVGAYFACGVRTDGTMVCWGNTPPTPPTGTFTSVSVSSGEASACAIRTDGTIVCWATTPDHTLVPPRGTFTSVSVGRTMACGVRTNGTLACWHEAGPITPPDGKFTSFSVGSSSLCGVRSDGTIACYVPRANGCSDRDVDYECTDYATPPEGTFTSVSAGMYSGCGVKADGTLACWGMYSIYFFVVVGTFTSVSVGGDGAVCAVKTDGTLVCWFQEHRGAGGPEGSF